MPFTYIRDAGCPWTRLRQGLRAGAFRRYEHTLDTWVQDNDMQQMALEEYYNFERVTEPEALAAIASRAEELPRPESRKRG